MEEYSLPTSALSKGIITGITIDVSGYHPSKNSFEGEPITEASVAGHKMASWKAIPRKGKIPEENPETEEDPTVPDGAAALVNCSEIICCTVFMPANATDAKAPENINLLIPL